MDYALEERIGHPDLFTGRKEELAYFLKWMGPGRGQAGMAGMEIKKI